MVIDAAGLIKGQVLNPEEKKLGTVESLVFDGQEAKIAYFLVSPNGVLKKLVALDINQTIAIERDLIVVDSAQDLESDLEHPNELIKHWGKVINVAAQTESGQKIGRVTDVCVDDQTGHITRFYLREFLRERIIPLQFLVSITPKAIIFKDIVTQPIFDQESTVVASVATN